MRVIITEDIVKKALNESIDEFMLEEGWFGNAWNSLKGSQLGQMAGKAGNWLKNAAAMYMDARTNGQWNNKYGIYANGTGKMTEMYYLNKWFGAHLNNIRQIEYRNNTPNADFSRSREYVERNGEKVYIDTEIQEKDVLTYVQKNITPNNFNTWVGKFIKNRQALELIDKYITDCSKNITDLQSAMKWLNIGSFTSSTQGQEYLKTKQSELGNQRKQYELNNIKSLIPQYQKYFYDNYEYSNTDEWKTNYQNFKESRYLPKNLIAFISNIVDYSIKNQNPKVFSLMTYKNFIKNYGKYYQ